VDAPLVTVTNVIPQPEFPEVEEASSWATELTATGEEVAKAEVEAGAAEEADPEDPPNVKVWAAFPEAHVA
jgi:hypothetical protein